MGQAYGPFDFALEPLGALSGRVTDEKPAPASPMPA